MKYFIYVDIFVFTIMALNLKTDTLNIFGSSSMLETRFTKFEVLSLNKSIMTPVGTSIKQFRYKQMLSAHVIFHRNTDMYLGTFSVFKCKDQYVDCVNVISYEISDMCSQIKVLTMFFNMKEMCKRSLACPFNGDYYLTNITLDADKFGSTFGLPTERYWEYYWKCNIMICEKDGHQILSGNLNFYFIQFRSRYGQPKF